MKGRTGLLKGGWEGGRGGKGAKAYLDDLACSAPGCCCQRAYLSFFWFKIWISILAAPLFFANRGDPSLSHRLNAGLSIDYGGDGRGRYCRYCVRRCLRA